MKNIDPLTAFARNGRAAQKAVDALGAGPAAGNVIPVAVAAIERDARQPRTEFDPVALQELADSIRERGVLQPVTVRRNPAGNGAARYTLIFGERRWRAAQLAGLPVIPAIVREFSDRDVLECQIIENLQREGLTPLDEARGYARLRGEFKVATQAIAAQIGKSLRHVQARLQLLELPAPVKTALEKDEIKVDTAQRIAREPDPAVQKKLVAAASGQTVAAGRQLVKAKTSAPVVAQASSLRDHRIRNQDGCATEKDEWRVGKRPGQKFWQIKRAPGWGVAHEVKDLREAAAWLKVQGADISQVSVLTKPPWKTLAEHVGGSIAPPEKRASFPPVEMMKADLRANGGRGLSSLARAINAGQPVKFPTGANAVRVTYLVEKVILKEDVDTLKSAGLPVRVEFGKVPFQSRHRPNRAKFWPVAMK